LISTGLMQNMCTIRRPRIINLNKRNCFSVSLASFHLFRVETHDHWVLEPKSDLHQVHPMYHDFPARQLCVYVYVSASKSSDYERCIADQSCIPDLPYCKDHILALPRRISICDLCMWGYSRLLAKCVILQNLCTNQPV
jgi:hypothetical protein